jgi:7-keto-8-aminopelargonate synthetase-like enzyme
VVPEGTARLRAQISAGHEPHHLDQFSDSLKKLKAEFG